MGFFSLLIFTTMVIMGIFKQEGGETLTDNLYISMPMLSAFILMLTSLITGVISVVKHKERSVIIYISTAIGLIVASFLLGELLVLH